MRPKLVMSSRVESDKDLDVKFALKNSFDGMDWSFAEDQMPFDTGSKEKFLNQIKRLEEHQVEVRYHTPFRHAEFGHQNHAIARQAVEFYFKTIELIANAKGKFLTLHIGLGNIPDDAISLDIAEESLKVLKEFAQHYRVTISLENLMHGPTSVPEAWFDLLKQVELPATFDFGHAKGCPAVLEGSWSPGKILDQIKGRLIHAHIYMREENGTHFPPETIDDIGIDLLDTLMESSCRWWVIELSEKADVLHTRRLLDAYLIEYLNEGGKKK